MKCAAEGCNNEVWLEGETLCGAHRPRPATQSEQTEELCRWCGDIHGPRCPYVKALEFSFVPGADRAIVAPPESWQQMVFVSRVEFLTPRDCVVAREKEPEPEGEYPRRRPMGA
jgi:hypothetical protein